MSLAEERRRQIESWVRPLYVELDGVDTFGVVTRRSSLVESLLDADLLAAGSIDEEYLELLLLYHGTAQRIGSTGPGGRWWLFLKGLGLSDAELRRLSVGLSRWRDAPRGSEEEALHDAVLLEDVGVGACARRLWWAGRKRIAFERSLSALDAGPVAERFKTTRGRHLAVVRSRAARAWLEELRDSVAAEDLTRRC